MRLILLGGPGAGKSTQAKRLSQTLNIPWISTGDELRAEIVAHTQLGEQVKPAIEQGELVKDETMIGLIRQWLQTTDAASGWLLDGYPRTAFQAEELNFLLDELGQTLDWAIWLEAPEDILRERSQARSRLDDQPEAVQRRIKLLYERTVPILDYYDYRQKLLSVDGNQTPERVEQDIKAALQTKRSI
ncbi:MAG: adenylate kinase [Pseudanabaenales cyanobacterium]|nr:adenylate kinase [Pseudanabaenales cyanobacterium]